jgi:hypothetical protein
MYFTRKEQLIIDTFGMSEAHGMKYMNDNGIRIGRQYYYELRKELRKRGKEIVFKTAQEFELKHIERCKTLRHLQTLSWENLDRETDPTKRQKIIDSIKELQYDIATFDEATRDLIETGETSIQVSEQQETVSGGEPPETVQGDTKHNERSSVLVRRQTETQKQS